MSLSLAYKLLAGTCDVSLSHCFLFFFKLCKTNIWRWLTKISTVVYIMKSSFSSCSRTTLFSPKTITIGFCVHVLQEVFCAHANAGNVMVQAFRMSHSKMCLCSVWLFEAKSNQDSVGSRENSAPLLIFLEKFKLGVWPMIRVITRNDFLPTYMSGQSNDY